jgi:hypothetical protein
MRAVLWNSMLSIAAVASFWTGRLDAGEPPAHRGLYAIWAPHAVLDLPYITGGQVVVQWADWEPADHAQRAEVEAIFRRVCAGLKRNQDPATGDLPSC